MHQLSTPEGRFAELVGTDASRPFVTFYDEATGERSELSRKSLANWVAKTRYLLGDELGLGVGDTALVAVPAHWISVPVLLGCFCAGLAVVDSGDADVAFTGPDSVALGAGLPELFVVNPARAAVGFGDDVPGGGTDYVAAVRPQADAWAGMHFPATGSDPALPGLTRSALMERAASRASDLGLDDGGRLLSTTAWTAAADWVDAVLAPLVVGGSLVLVTNTDDETVLARRADQERATARL